MIKKNINLHDHLRALLTDTLPYETPVIFSNFFFHAALKNGRSELPAHIEQAIFLNKKQSYTVPFIYEVERPYDQPRRLSLLHPAAQLKVCDLYHKYAELLVYLCSRGDYSIRYPSGVARHLYEKKGLDQRVEGEEAEGVEVEPPPFVAERAVASSYFKYRDFNVQYKFFESRAFEELEERFPYMGSFDVKKCFYNIYSHTLPWAVKGKGFAKVPSNRLKGSVENDLDFVMQFSNHGETNGIPVGPEVSRVFAEIIFQSLDVTIERRLGKKQLRRRVDYDIRRYVDDYFVFSDSREKINIIRNEIEEVLEPNRLYLNESKSNTQHRPFLTKLSCAKRDVSASLSEFSAGIRACCMEQRPGKALSIQKRFIDGIRSASVKYDVEIEPVAKFALSVLVKIAPSILGEANTHSEKNVQDDWFIRLARVITKSVGFLYAVAPNVRSSFLVSRVMLSMHSQSARRSAEVVREVELLLAQQLRKFFARGKELGLPGIADLNLITVHRAIAGKSLLQANFLRDWFKIPGADSADKGKRKRHLGYFHICVLVFYVRDCGAYSDMREELLQIVLSDLEAESDAGNIHIYADLVMLTLDMLSCPWLEGVDKKRFARSLVRSIEEKGLSQETLNKRANQVVRYCKDRTWFIDWRSKDYLSHLLQKKELIPSYY